MGMLGGVFAPPTGPDVNACGAWPSSPYFGLVIRRGRDKRPNRWPRRACWVACLRLPARWHPMYLLATALFSLTAGHEGKHLFAPASDRRHLHRLIAIGRPGQGRACRT